MKFTATLGKLLHFIMIPRLGVEWCILFQDRLFEIRAVGIYRIYIVLAFKADAVAASVGDAAFAAGGI